MNKNLGIININDRITHIYVNDRFLNRIQDCFNDTFTCILFAKKDRVSMARLINFTLSH